MGISYGTGSSNTKRIPPGLHLAVCDMVVDVGLQESMFGTKQKVYIRFEVPSERWKFEKDGLQQEGPGVIGAFFTASMHRNATLRKRLEGWRSKPFTEDEAKAFDITTLLGKSCMLSVQESDAGDQIYSNIVGISPLPKGMNPTHAELPLLAYGGDVRDTFDRLPEWIKKKIEGQVPPPQRENFDADSIEGPPITDDDIPF